MTDAERQLWARLRGKQLLGVQFYRQKPIGNYMVDFYAPAAKLVIEVDGCQHLEPEHQLKDTLRDECLAPEGLAVMRFDNVQVLRETDAVMSQILDRISAVLVEIPPESPFSNGGTQAQPVIASSGPKEVPL